MRILIDIGHPAHVHYFRNFIKRMELAGHEFMVSARDKEVTHKLLDEYSIPYFNRGKGKNGLVGKILYMLVADFRLLRRTRKFKPDVYLSFVSPYAAQVAWLRRKPHIAFDDTEHAKIARKFYLPFSKLVLTPFCFELDIGSKQRYFNSFMELSYLHPSIVEETPVDHPDVPKKPYAFMRFVAWNANHDVGQSGLNLDTKREIIEKLSPHYDILISSEGDCPEEFQQYLVKISPSSIHHVLKNASVFIGEGATMAVEAAFLGTPSMYINSLNAGTLNEVERMGLMDSFRSSEGVIERVDEFLANNEDDQSIRDQKLQKLNEFMNPTDLLEWIFVKKMNSLTKISRKINISDVEA
jgi:predicted glycosyltransferase